jgi:hypothetical protein
MVIMHSLLDFLHKELDLCVKKIPFLMGFISARLDAHISAHVQIEVAAVVGVPCCQSTKKTARERAAMG